MSIDYTAAINQITEACFSRLNFDGSLRRNPVSIKRESGHCLLVDEYRLVPSSDSASFVFEPWTQKFFPDAEFPEVSLNTPYPPSESPFLSFKSTGTGLPPCFSFPEWCWGDVDERRYSYFQIETALTQRNVAGAARALASLSAGDSSTPRAFYLKGVLSVITGQWLQARNCFHQSAQNGNISACLAEQQAVAGAIADFYTSHPEIAVAVRAERWKEVIQLIDISQYPLHASAILIYLRAVREGCVWSRLDLALERGQLLLNHDLLFPDALADYWNLLLTARRDSCARSIAALAYQLYPLLPGSFRMMCISELLAGSFDKALQYCMPVLLKRSNLIPFLKVLRLYCQYSRRGDKFRHVFAMAADIQPGGIDANLLAVEAIETNQKTVELLEQIAARPGDSQGEALLARCQLLIEEGKQLEAIRLLRTVLHESLQNGSPISPFLITRLSELLRNEHEPELALDLWQLAGLPDREGALSLGPHPLLEYACTLIETGHLDQGIEHLNFLRTFFSEEPRVKETFQQVTCGSFDS